MAKFKKGDEIIVIDTKDGLKYYGEINDVNNHLIYIELFDNSYPYNIIFNLNSIVSINERFINLQLTPETNDMKFKVGDKVHCTHVRNKGIITKIKNGGRYPIVVDFQNIGFQNYTLTGRYWDDKPITLFKIESESDDNQNTTEVKPNDGHHIKKSNKLLKFKNEDILFF